MAIDAKPRAAKPHHRFEPDRNFPGKGYLRDHLLQARASARGASLAYINAPTNPIPHGRAKCPPGGINWVTEGLEQDAREVSANCVSELLQSR